MYRKLAFAVVMMGLVGCQDWTVCLSPPFDADDVITRDEIIGRYADTTGDTESAFVITKPDDDRYQLTYPADKDGEVTFEVTLFALDGVEFMALRPTALAPGRDGFEQMHLIRGYTFMRVEVTEHELKVVPFLPKEIATYIKEHPRTIDHVWEDDRPVLTASTGKLRWFIRRYMKREEAFSDPIVLKRVP